MTNFQKQLVLVAIVLILYTTPVLGKNFTIITPYLGTENNTYVDGQYGIELKDSQTMKGLYFQSANPEKRQWNIFLYQTADINHSDLWGMNFIYDVYFGADGRGKKVIGVGMNYLDMNLAGEDIPTKNGTLDALKLPLTVFSPYLRVGQYFDLGGDKIHYTVLPWFGGQLDKSQGMGLVDFPGPGKKEFKIDDEQYSWIAGVNLKMDLHHYLQLEAKRSAIYNSDHFFNKSSAILNLLLSRKIGFSYRYNYSETSMGTDSYSILGVAVVF